MVHITDQVEQIVRKSGVKDGLCFVSPMHITAAIYVNDLEDGLIEDMRKWLEELGPSAPWSNGGCNSGGNIPCRGAPQIAHTSAFKVISAPQQEQKAAM